MDKFLLREKYGDHFATDLPDGTVIPWRILTVGEFVKYDRLIRSKHILPAEIEDEIFSLCVLNPILVKRKGSLPAGSVSTVAQNILVFSGPSDVQELNMVLNASRHVTEQIFHQIAIVISQAFPAYKLEEIYAMTFEDMMLRLAQAEVKLMKIGVLTEPLDFSGNIATPETSRPQEAPDPLPVQDLKRAFDKQQLVKESEPPTRKLSKKTVITSKDVQESEMGYTGHEKEDKVILEHKMINETAALPHIQEYLAQMKKDGKLTIKSHEEREAEAKQRAEENKAYIAKMNQLKGLQDKEQLEKMAAQMKDKSNQKRKRKKRLSTKR